MEWGGALVFEGVFYLYTIFDQRPVDIIDQVECGVHESLHIYPCMGSSTSPGIDTRRKGPTAFSVSSLPKDTGKVG